MAMEARIVRATEGDAEVISELAGRIWRAHYPGIISTEQIEYMLATMYSIKTLRQEMGGRGIRYNRLLAGEQFVGFASYGSAEESRWADCNCDTVKLHKLYLHPDWHGRG
jgi:diamine N-acetyltransferase